MNNPKYVMSVKSENNPEMNRESASVDRDAILFFLNDYLYENYEKIPDDLQLTISNTNIEDVTLNSWIKEGKMGYPLEYWINVCDYENRFNDPDCEITFDEFCHNSGAQFVITRYTSVCGKYWSGCIMKDKQKIIEYSNFKGRTNEELEKMLFAYSDKIEDVAGLLVDKLNGVKEEYICDRCKGDKQVKIKMPKAKIVNETMSDNKKI